MLNSEKNSGEAAKLLPGLDQSIRDTLEQLKVLNKERDSIAKEMWDKDNFLPYQLPPANLPDRVERYNRYHYLTSEISLLQDKFAGMAIASVNESTAQVAESSRRLEAMTGKLQRFTGYLILATFLLIISSVITLYVQNGTSLFAVAGILGIIVFGLLILYDFLKNT